MVNASVFYYRENGSEGMTGSLLEVVPVTLQFKVNITSGTPLSYLWDFGDGTTSAIKEPLHTFYSHGNHRIILSITDATDVSLPTPLEFHLGKIDFSAGNVRGLKPLSVDFTNTSVAPEGCHFTGWVWNFGDGATGAANAPTHVYTENGKYNVKLDAVLSIP